MPIIIDYKIRLDGVPLEGAMEFTGDLLPEPRDSFILSIGDRNLDAIVAEVGELSPYKGRLHLRIRFEHYPVKGLRRLVRWLAIWTTPGAVPAETSGTRRRG